MSIYSKATLNTQDKIMSMLVHNEQNFSFRMENSLLYLISRCHHFMLVGSV